MKKNEVWARRETASRDGSAKLRRPAAGFVGVLLITALFWGTIALQRVLPDATASQPPDSGRIYDLTNIWTIHLKFTPEQWEAMEPKSGGNQFFGGGPGGRPGMGGADAGGRTLGPALMSQGDLDRNGRITREEFARLARDWLRAWDTNQTASLDGEEIRAGLDLIGNPAGGGMASMLLGAEGKRNGIASAFGIEFEYVHADLEFEGRLLSDVGVRYKGNGTFLESRDSLKRPLKIDLNKFAKGQSLGKVTTLTLQNNVTDGSLMNEVLAYRLYRDAGVPAPATAYARVFVTVPGKHDRTCFGLYSLVEAVDKQFAERHFDTKRGALFKPVIPSLFTDLGADWAAYRQVYDPKSELYDEQKKAVMDLSRFVTQADDAAFAAHIGEFIDLPEFARFMAVMVYLSDLDGILGPGQNLYLHLHPKTQQFRFIPWDQDHSWGQFNRASQEQRDQLSIHRPWQGENFFLERMFKVEAFKDLYLERLDEYSKTLFDPDRIARQVDEIAAAIRPAVQAESESKLSRFDRLVSGKALSTPGPFGGGETKPIKPFARVRTQSVIDQLAGKSQGLVAGGDFRPGFGGGDGLGSMFGQPLLLYLDSDKDGSVSKAELDAGFARLFQAWDTEGSGSLTLANIGAGIAKDLPRPAPGFRSFGGGPRGPGRGPGVPVGRGAPGTATVITGTRDPGLFLGEHWGMSAFSREVPNGKYLAKLHFAETYEGITGPGQRVFSLNVQGQELKDFDVWAKAGGPARAHTETVPVDVTNGVFRITFTRQIENPTINAIELVARTEGAAAPASSAPVLRIKAGSSEPFTDSNGQVWQPDRGFEGGMMGQVAGGSMRFPAGPDGGPLQGQGPPSNRPNTQTP